MATLYTGQTSCGTYTYTRVKVDYDYSTSKATAKLLHSRTNTWTGSEYADGCVFTFGGVSTGSIYISTGSLGKHTDTQIASVTFSFSNAGGTYSGSTSGYNAPYKFSGSVTIPAQTFTITYNANGGTGAPGNQTKTYGTNLTLSSTKPTKANTTANGYTVTYNGNGGTASKTSDTATDTTTYTFANWKDGAGTTYNAGGSYTKNQADTLTAQWTSSTSKGAVTAATATKSNTTSTRKVTFNANGGSCSTTSANSTATVTYSCNGWYTAASGGTKRASSGASFTPSATETLYAQYGSSTGTFSAVTLPSASKASVTNTRTVTFDAKGGECDITSLSSSSTTSYTHTGWFTATSGGTKRGAAGGSYTPSAAETIYAQFSSSSTEYPAITLPTPTRNKYLFKGWSTDPNATTGMMGTYIPTGTETLYAIWELNIKGNVYLKVNGEWKLASKIAYKSNWGSGSGTIEDLTVELNDYENALDEQGTTIESIVQALQNKGSEVNAKEYMAGFFNDTIETFSNEYITYTHSYCICNKNKLKKIVLNGVTSLSNYAISSCSALHTVELGGVTSIGSGSFNGCKALATLIIRTPSVCSLANINSISPTLIASGTGYIYVPDNLVNSYKTATNWSDYANQIKGISELEG